MSALLPLSFQRLGTARNPRPSLTNAERLQAYRMAVEPMLGNYWPWKFTQVYGGGGVESRHASHGSEDCGPSQGWCQIGFESRQTDATTSSRSSALPASTLSARGPASLTLSPEGGDSGATDGDTQ